MIKSVFAICCIVELSIIILTSYKYLDQTTRLYNDTSADDVETSDLCIFVPGALKDDVHSIETEIVMKTWGITNLNSVKIYYFFDLFDFHKFNQMDENYAKTHELNIIFQQKLMYQNQIKSFASEITDPNDYTSNLNKNFHIGQFIFLPAIRGHLADKYLKLVQFLGSSIKQQRSSFHHCQWFMKTDTDAYVRTKQLKNWLSCLDTQIPLYFGHKVYSMKKSQLKIFALFGYAQIWNKKFMMDIYFPTANNCLDIANNFEPTDINSKQRLESQSDLIKAIHNVAIDKSNINNDFTYFKNVQKLPVDVMRSNKIINISAHAYAAEHAHFRADDANHGWCFAIHGINRHISVDLKFVLASKHLGRAPKLNHSDILNQLKSRSNHAQIDNFKCSFVIHRLSSEGIVAFHEFFQNDVWNDIHSLQDANVCIDQGSWNRKPWLDSALQPYSSNVDLIDIEFTKRLWVSGFRNCPTDFSFA